MEITKEEASMMCEFIEQNLIQTIRNDTEIDSMIWLVGISDMFKLL